MTICAIEKKCNQEVIYAMRKENIRRRCIAILCLIMSVCMLLSPVSAFAAEDCEHPKDNIAIDIVDNEEVITCNSCGKILGKNHIVNIDDLDNGYLIDIGSEEYNKYSEAGYELYGMHILLYTPSQDEFIKISRMSDDTADESTYFQIFNLKNETDFLGLVGNLLVDDQNEELYKRFESCFIKEYNGESVCKLELEGGVQYAFLIAEESHSDLKYKISVDQGYKTSSDGMWKYEILDDDTINIVQYVGKAENITIPTEIENKHITQIQIDAFKDKNIIELHIDEYEKKYYENIDFKSIIESLSGLKDLYMHRICGDSYTLTNGTVHYLCDEELKKSFENQKPDDCHSFLFPYWITCTCKCGYSKERDIVPGTQDRYGKDVHDTELKKIIEPTCTEDGFDLYECKNCKYTEKRNVKSAKGHKFVKGETVEPDCKTHTDGHYSGDICSVCGYTQNEKTIPWSHDYEITNAKNATCLSDGYTGDKVCKNCGDTIKGSKIEALGDNWIVENNDVVCSRCGRHPLKSDDWYYEINKDNKTAKLIAYLGTDLADKQELTIPYSIDGLKVTDIITDRSIVFCSKNAQIALNNTKYYDTYIHSNLLNIKNIGDLFYESRPDYYLLSCSKSAEFLGYKDCVNKKEGEYGNKNAMCYLHCSICGENFTDDSIEYAPRYSSHDFTVETTRKEPTCVEDGYVTYKCSRCDETETITLKKSGHSWDSGIVSKKTTCESFGELLYTCNNCGETKTETLTGDEKYSELSDMQKKIYKHADTLVQIKRIEPTCTSVGYTEGLKCSKCGEIIIEPTIIPVIAHEYTSSVKEPTCTEKGYTEYICKNCGNTYRDNYVNALGHSPKYELKGKKIEGTYPESKHRYIDSETFNFSDNGADAYELTFDSSTYVYQSDYKGDYIVIFDSTGKEIGRYTGYELSGKTITVNSSSFTIKLEVNSDVTGCYGFKITNINGLYKTYDIGNEEPTCTESGYTSGKYCTRCNTWYEGHKELPALGHKTESIIVKPTCTEKGYTKYVCSVCQKETKDRDNYTNALGHDYKKTVTQPTCTEKGYTEYKCKVCGYSYKGDYTEATGHTIVTDKGVQPTCTESGLTEGKHCSVCGIVLEEQTKIDALGHDFRGNDGYIPASCTENGFSGIGNCNRCGMKSKGVILKATGHKYSVSKVEPTCTHKGYYLYTCTNCGDEIIEYGYKDITEHKYADKIISPSCTEQGYTLHTCSECGYSYKDNYVEAIGHESVLISNAEAPTCTAAGHTAATKCKKCGVVTAEEQIIPALGHNYSGQAVNCGNGRHYYACINGCGTYGVNNTENKTENCYNNSDSGVCDVCKGKIETEHRYRKNIISNPTYDSEGECKYECVICGDTYTEKIPKLICSHKNTKTVKEQATCYKDGKTEEICLTCGKVISSTIIPKLNHNIITEVVKEPTCTESGIKKEHCTLCGMTVSEMEIPKMQHSIKSVIVNPTCTEHGYTKYVCTMCNKEVKERDNFTEPLGHSYFEVERIEPTCEEKGYTSYKCSTCGELYIEESASKGHKWAYSVKNGTCIEKTQKIKTCQSCGKIETISLDYGTHKYLIKTSPATISSDGYVKKTCEYCGKSHISEKIVKIQNISLSAKSYVFNGKNKKPNVTIKDAKGKLLKYGRDFKLIYDKNCKSIGTHKVKVIFTGNRYRGTKILKYVIKPAAVSLKKITVKKKSFSLSWRKNKNISGYEVQYGTDKNFKKSSKKSVSKNKTNVTVKNLKSGRKYYIRIRGYKSVSGKKVYSSWSKTQIITEV